MREIKFRGWNKTKSCFEKDFSINNNGILTLPHNTKTKNTIIVLQYTNLKDKNGVEIYEGDIVEYSSEVYNQSIQDKGVVYFEKGAFCYKNNKNESWLLDECMYDEQQTSVLNSKLKVIGNIYENPELMK